MRLRKVLSSVRMKQTCLQVLQASQAWLFVLVILVLRTGGLSGPQGQSLILGFHKVRSCLKKQNRLLVAYAFNSSTHEAEVRQRRAWSSGLLSSGQPGLFSGTLIQSKTKATQILWFKTDLAHWWIAAVLYLGRLHLALCPCEDTKVYKCNVNVNCPLRMHSLYPALADF